MRSITHLHSLLVTEICAQTVYGYTDLKEIEKILHVKDYAKFIHKSACYVKR